MINRVVLVTLTISFGAGVMLVGAIPGRVALAQDNSTPTPTAAATVGAATPHIWFHENFSTRANRWRLFDLSGKSTIAYEEPGQLPGLDLVAQVADYPFWTIPDSDLRLDHFDMTVSLSSLEGGEDSRVGAIVNYRAENDMVVMAISPTGTVSLGRFYFGVWTDLMPPAQVTIDLSQPITLRAKLDTDRNLTVTVNGNPGGTGQIEDFRPAGFGLFALTGQNGGVKVIFRSFIVSDL